MLFILIMLTESLELEPSWPSDCHCNAGEWPPKRANSSSSLPLDTLFGSPHSAWLEDPKGSVHGEETPRQQRSGHRPAGCWCLGDRRRGLGFWLGPSGRLPIPYGDPRGPGRG